ncbi:MAG: hypothetical protein K2X93_03110 [Candidatus Obscuribacterales bacterium]|nr:hypothetical protein [Candidatus Obscuribacterales bacterium]
MQNNGTATNNATLKQALLAVVLTVGLSSLALNPAFAQGFETQPMLSEQQPQGMIPNQDSFLPPDVVPQPDNGAPGMPGQMMMSATPGQLSAKPPDAHMNLNPANGVQTAQGMRKALFDSLMGNTQLSNQMPQLDPAMGGVGGNFGQQATPYNTPSMPGQYAIGQPDWLSQVNNSNSTQYGNSSQTQTLTGGSRVPIVRRDMRKGGFANNLSGGSALGAGLLTGLVRRPNSLFGLGFTGLTLTGLGMRNGFRY